MTPKFRVGVQENVPPPEPQAEPVTVNSPPVVVSTHLPAIRPVTFKLEAMRFVVVAVPVTARFVVVAFVVVEFSAVKFWRVVEPTTVKSPDELIVVVAVPPKYELPKTERRVVDAPPLQIFKAEKVWAPFNKATLAERAESEIEVAGSVNVPVVRVRPFKAVKSPPKVPAPCAETFPALVVVALPLTINV